MEKKNSAAVAGLVLGIIALVINFFSAIPFAGLIALALGIVGLICSSKGSKAAKENGVGGGVATAGLVMSIIAVVLGGIFFLACTVCPLCAAGAIAGAGALA